MIITDQKLTDAEAEADAAARELAGLPPNVDDDRWATVSSRDRRARAALDLERARAERESRELAARDERERVASSALAGFVRELETALAAVVAAVAAGSLPAALASVPTYNATLARQHAQLLRLDLRLSDSFDHATGAGEQGTVRLRGRFWTPMDAATVAVRMTLRQLLSAVDPRHMTVRNLTQLAALDPRVDALFAEVPDLPRFVPPARERPPGPAWDRPKPALAPSLQRAELDRLQHPQPTPGWKESFAARYGVAGGGDVA